MIIAIEGAAHKNEIGGYDEIATIGIDHHGKQTFDQSYSNTCPLTQELLQIFEAQSIIRMAIHPAIWGHAKTGNDILQEAGNPQADVWNGDSVRRSQIEDGVLAALKKHYNLDM